VAKPEIQPRMARHWSALNTFVVMPDDIHGIIVRATPVIALIQVKADRPDINNVRHSRMVLSGVHVLLLQNYKTGFPLSRE
jgi:hypothetical protein